MKVRALTSSAGRAKTTEARAAIIERNFMVTHAEVVGKKAAGEGSDERVGAVLGAE